MINILCPVQSYSKLYEAKFQFNDVWFNDIPGFMTEIYWSKLNSFPITTI